MEGMMAGAPLVIAVVGGGQIGSRHLQALARFSAADTLYLCDPSEAARQVCEQRYKDVAGEASPKLISIDGPGALPDQLDVVIVATSAAIRRPVIESVATAARKVRYWILEKVAFQRDADFVAVEALLAGRGEPAWVNCPRRLYPRHQAMAQALKGLRRLDMTVAGGGWGLACNAIHFMDLFAFYAGSPIALVDVSGLAPAPVASKRPGYWEVMGTLEVTTAGGHRLRLVCDETTTPTVVTLQSDRATMLYHEGKGTGLAATQDGEWRWEGFEQPALAQSQLSDKAVRQLIEGGACELPTLAESRSTHAPLLAALSGYFAAHLDLEDGLCPIT